MLSMCLYLKSADSLLSSDKRHWNRNTAYVLRRRGPLIDVFIIQSACNSLIRSNSPPKIWQFDWLMTAQCPDAILALHSVSLSTQQNVLYYVKNNVCKKVFS